ncbi:FeoA family protein [Salipaludibacillus aurantiacus]|uniref:Ferrous iron transport protein A n=1 Tax=Salipaludibacillus aurantiacus TaxID=1601833 RepID=A0A1H9SAK4_9BACI|nr:FeoA family protein [Salipaludibacillus aurantiacus]SER82032.1 ferrous iron transport protein A [Salipaludibacillus aurantiacus]
MKNEGLCKLARATVCRVKKLPDCPLLEGLGIEVGTEFCIKQKSPWRGPIVVETKGRRQLAIDYHIASQFEVEEVNGGVLSRK